MFKLAEMKLSRLVALRFLGTTNSGDSFCLEILELQITKYMSSHAHTYALNLVASWLSKLPYPPDRDGALDR